MAPSLGICKFCEKEQAKYKCPTCSAPYCSFACYGPHKAKHAEEKAAMPEPAAVAEPTPVDDTNVPEPAANPVAEEADQSKAAPLDFEAILQNGPLMAAMQNNSNLKGRLHAIYNCTQKAAFEAENARLHAQNAHYQRGRGGRGRGGRHFNRKPLDWTIERGMNRGLRKIQSMRHGGKEEDKDLEEWAQVVMSIIEPDTTPGVYS